MTRLYLIGGLLALSLAFQSCGSKKDAQADYQYQQWLA